jgi:hypothetical protein
LIPFHVVKNSPRFAAVAEVEGRSDLVADSGKADRLCRLRQVGLSLDLSDALVLFACSVATSGFSFVRSPAQANRGSFLI